MAVAFDAVGASDQGNVSSLSWSHTASGADRFAIIGIMLQNGSIVDSVTYGAIDCSLVTNALGDNVGDTRSELWETDSEPPTTAQTVTVNMSSMSQSSAQSISFTGVDITGPTSNGLGFASDSHPDLITMGISVSSNGLVVGCIAVVGEDPIESAGTDQRWALSQAGDRNYGATSATSDLQWTVVADTPFSSAGCNIIAVSAARRRFIST